MLGAFIEQRLSENEMRVLESSFSQLGYSLFTLSNEMKMSIDMYKMIEVYLMESIQSSVLNFYITI